MNVLSNRFLLSALFSLCVVAFASAQGFIRVYDQPGLQTIPGTIVAAAATPDGGYLLGYNGHVARADAEGHILWIKPTSHDLNELRNDFIQLPDGRFLLATCIDGIQTANHVSLFEPDGDLIWTKRYAGFIRVARTTRGLAVVNRTGRNAYALFELDLQGNALWTKNYNPATEVEFVYELLVNADGSLTVAMTQNRQFRLVRADATGNIRSDSVYKAGSSINFGGRMFHAKQGGYIFVEEGDIGSGSMFHIASNGQLRWERQLNAGQLSTTQTPDGGFFMIASSQATMYALRYDSLGRELFQRTYQLPRRHDALNGLHPTPDGGMIIGGGLSNPARGFIIRTDVRGVAYPNLLVGRIAMDQNKNCRPDPVERPLGGWKVRANRLRDGIDFFTTTDDKGNYAIHLDTGRYRVTTLSPGPLWSVCNPVQWLQFNNQKGDTLRADFPIKDSILCPLMDVSLGTSLSIKCRDNRYTVRWCNNGTQTASNARVAVVLPRGMRYLASARPLARQTRDSLWFNIGDVAVAECGDMWVSLLADCDSIPEGKTVCVEAHIFPNKLCITPGNWSGAEIIASARCKGDTSVEFRLRNVGASTSMALDYIITEDVVVLKRGSFDLLPGQDKIMSHPAKNRALRIEAGQERNFPYLSMPSAGIEGCGTGPVGPPGVLLQFPVNDGSPFVDIDCQLVLGNDQSNRMQAQPVGYGERRFVASGVPITYGTRFDNLSTDTITTVILRDTLSPWLDPATLQIGAASHPFTWKLKDNGVLERRFENIQLPHRAANEAASGGFSQYIIQPRRDTPNGTVVSNGSALFFDSETPVRLPLIFHTIGREFYTVSIKPDPVWHHNQIAQIAPNPFTDYTRISVPGAENRPLRLILTNSVGQMVFTSHFQQGQLTLLRSDLEAGAYFYQIADPEGKTAGRGTLVVQ